VELQITHRWASSLATWTGRSASHRTHQLPPPAMFMAPR